MKPSRVAPALCVATALLVTPAAAGRTDHLMCYKMADQSDIAAAVDMIADLQPQFSRVGCELVKPIEFCVPATKTNVQPPPTANALHGQPLREDYVCYLARCDKKVTQPANQLVADQFGVRRASRFKASKVCVPATKFPLPCGDAESPTCGGVCPPGEQCVGNAAGCACRPQPCGGVPDKAGMCGGACPDGRLCRPGTTTAGKTACGCQQTPPPPCGTDPLTGSCGGDCTDATLKCQPGAGGACACLPAPAPAQFCGPDAGGACGGVCPDPADTCIAAPAGSTTPCLCAPSPCDQDPITGTCAGSCGDPALPDVCHLDPVTKQCVCGPPPCGKDAAAGQCAGDCPPGLTCSPDATNGCACAGPCGFDAQHVCGGACPAGQVCAQQGQECTCVSPPACGFGAEVPGLCSGACPPGLRCQTREADPATLFCLCLP
jgi:hypothetical protein